MQILRFAPANRTHRGIGYFELPMMAALDYLAHEIRYRTPVRQKLLYELCAFRYTEIDFIDLDDSWYQDMGYLTAGLIDCLSIVAYCPLCCTYFTGVELRREEWQDQAGMAGRRYTCCQEHELLRVTDSHTTYFRGYTYAD